MTGAKRYPIAPKAQAAGLAGTVAGIVIYLLQTYAFKGGDVPAGLVSLIYAVVPGLLALGAAYIAPHQVRPGDPVLAITTAPQPPVTVQTPAPPTAVTPPPEPPAA